MLYHLLGYDMLLDTFPCIVLLSVPLHHPYGQHLGRERRAIPANPLAPAVKYEGTKRRGTGASKTCLEPGASSRLKSPPPRNTPRPATAPGTKDSSWAAAEPLKCTDVGSSGSLKTGAQLRAYILAPAALHPASHSAPPSASHSARTALLPARALGPGTARPSRSCSGLLGGRGGHSPPSAEPNGLCPAQRPGCRASGDFVSGREGTKPACLGLSPPGPGADFRFVPGHHSQTHRAAWSVWPRRLPGLEGSPAPRRVCIWFVHDLPVRIRAIGPRPR